MQRSSARPKLELEHARWYVRYSAATFFVLCALLLNNLPPAAPLPFLFFFAAVAVTARFVGFGPAIYATVLSAAVADFFLLGPKHTFSNTPQDIMRVLLFALVALTIVSLAKQKSVMERQSVEDQAKLGAIVNSSDDAIFSKTMDGTITTWNPAAQALYGYTPEEVIGKNVRLLADDHRKNEITEIMLKLGRGEKIEHFETERYNNKGERLHVSLSISPLHGPDGKIMGAATIARNITAQKLGEEALRRTEKLAAAGRLAATIAHEINNPLEAITNLLYLMRFNDSLDERGRKHLMMAEQELARVAHLTRQTLGFYRDTSAMVPVDLPTALDQVMDIYKLRLESKRISLDRDYRETQNVMAFPGELRQVFSNLIGNAIDAIGPGGGRIVVRLARGRDWTRPSVTGVRITVSDSGPGISPEHREKIFEPFFTTKKDVGTGLGLWVSREIVEKHDGKIEVRSSVNGKHRGTTFSMFLPAGEVELQSLRRA